MTILHIILVLAAALSRNNAALVFAGLTCAHAGLYYQFSGFPYYFSAALTDLMAIAIMVYVPSRITGKLMAVSFCSILLNLYGWIIYEAYLAPITYNAAFALLYLYSIAVIGGGDAGYHHLYSRLRGFLNRHMAGHMHH